MEWFWNRGKKKEEVNPEEAAKDVSNEHRRGGNMLLDALMEIRLPREEKPKQEGAEQPDDAGKSKKEERLDRIAAIVRGCRVELEQARPSDKDTSEIDRNIQLLILDLRNAIAEGDWERADVVSQYVGKAITSLRADFERVTPEAEKAELKNRCEQVRRMVSVAGLREKLLEFRKDNAKIELQIAENEKRYKEMEASLRESRKAHPELEEELQKFLGNTDPDAMLSGKATQYSTLKKRVVDLYNSIGTLYLTSANIDAHMQSIEGALLACENQMLQNATTLNGDIVREIENLTAEFEEQRAMNAQSMEKLEAVTQRIREGTKKYYASKANLDRLLDIEIQYSDMIRRQKQMEKNMAEGARKQREENARLEQEKRELEEAAKREQEELENQNNNEEAPQLIDLGD